MTEQNPYAPPQSDLASEEQPRDDAVCFFHYRRSSASWLNVIPIAFLLFVSVSYVQIYSREISIFDSPLPALLIIAGWLYLLFITVRPRIFEFRVGLATIRWKRPWPNACDITLQVTDISRVTYEGSEISLETEDGKSFRPSPPCYGYSSQEVVAAVTDAVRYQLPSVQVRTEKKSIFRSMAKATRQAIDWLSG